MFKLLPLLSRPDGAFIFLPIFVLFSTVAEFRLEVLLLGMGSLVFIALK